MKEKILQIADDLEALAKKHNDGEIDNAAQLLRKLVSSEETENNAETNEGGEPESGEGDGEGGNGGNNPPHKPPFTPPNP